MRDGCRWKRSRKALSVSQITAVNFATELKARWLFRRCERANHLKFSEMQAHSMA
jgi:hypothetical protein